MVKVQKQHKASPTSSHLPQSPFPSCVTVPGKVNTLSLCQKWDFILLPQQFLHLALFSVPPSLSSPPLPPFAATSGTQLLIYLCGLCCFFLFFCFSKSDLKVLYLVLLAVSLHLMRSAITFCHNWSLCNYMLHHRIFLPPPPNSTAAHMADRNRIVSCLFGWRPS